MIKSINRTEIIIRIRSLILFISTVTMHFLVLCTLVVLVIMVNFGYIHGATCLCSCCSGISCTATSVGNITVTSCSSCIASLCQSTYSSTCVSVNGVTSSSCVSSNIATTSSSSYVNNGTSYYSAGSSDAHTFFKSIYRTFSMAIISFPILIYQKIKW